MRDQRVSLSLRDSQLFRILKAFSQAGSIEHRKMLGLYVDPRDTASYGEIGVPKIKSNEYAYRVRFFTAMLLFLHFSYVIMPTIPVISIT